MNIFKKIAKYRRLIKMIEFKKIEISIAKINIQAYKYIDPMGVDHPDVLNDLYTKQYVLMLQLKRLENLLDELNF